MSKESEAFYIVKYWAENCCETAYDEFSEVEEALRFIVKLKEQDASSIELHRTERLKYELKAHLKAHLL